MTRQKQMILWAAQSRHDHPTADQLYLEVRAKDSKISRGTVYRNLEQLSQNGMLRHVRLPGADRFDCRLDDHYHMICKDCGAVFDIPLGYQTQMDEQVMEMTGFRIERHRTTFEGVCVSCQKKTQQE